MGRPPGAWRAAEVVDAARLVVVAAEVVDAARLVVVVAVDAELRAAAAVVDGRPEQPARSRASRSK